jgi:hypothetical protein
MENIEQNSENTENTENTVGCRTCKNSGINSTQKWIVALSIYIFLTSIFGTYVLIKSLVDYIQ